jgi:NADH-quinone oxidoreductase subunit N
MILKDFITFLPEIFLLVYGVITIFCAAFNIDRAADVLSSLFKGVLISGLVFYVWFGASTIDTGIFSGLMIQNKYTVFSKFLMLTLSLGVYVSIKPFLENDGLQKPEFMFLLATSICGYMLMVSSQNFISLFLSMELAGFATYLMIAFSRDKDLCIEAALKYFVLGSVSAAFFLFGASFLYGIGGSNSYNVLYHSFSDASSVNIFVYAGMAFVFLSFAFKTSLAPFHMWTPDVYEGSPMPVTTFITTVPKVAAVFVFARIFMEVFYVQKDVWQNAFAVFAFLSMVVGSFTALFQKALKRIIAYSTISHMGYAIMGLMCGTFSGNTALLQYIVIYTITTVGVFCCLLLLRRQGTYIESIEDLKGLSASNPLISAALMLFLFSLAGVPPLSGFFAKFEIFYVALESGFLFLAISGMLTSVVAAGFYIKLIHAMYFYKEVAITTDKNMFNMTKVVLLISLLFNVFYICSPHILGEYSYKAVKSIFAKI